MVVRVLAFASASDALGGRALDVELPEGATVADLRAALTARRPALAPLWPRLAVAVGGEISTGDAALSEGVEVALLPPVSGGSDAPAGEDRVRSPETTPVLVDSPIDVAAAIAAVRSPSRGAVLAFVGTVRDRDRREGAAPAGRRVERLTYSAYRPMAEERLRRIARELAAGGDDLGVAIVHRLGEVAAGEASVVIAVASPHREAAYAASRTALERLKREVPIWKRERFADGATVWREEEPLDAPAGGARGGVEA